MESEVNKCIAVVKKYLKMRDMKYRELESNLKIAAKVCFKNFYKNKAAIIKSSALYILDLFLRFSQRKERLMTVK